MRELLIGCDLIIGGDREGIGIEYFYSLPKGHFVNELLAAVSENPLNECHYGPG